MKAGRAFERKVAKLFSCAPDFHHGQWIEFQDSGQYHMAQPDIFFRRSRGKLFIAEVKVSFTENAFIQLFDLYQPLLEYIYAISASKVVPFVVCKHLTEEAFRLSRLVHTPFSMLQDLAEVEPGMVLTWDGKSQIPTGARR